jgi:hypothetical protein
MKLAEFTKEVNGKTFQLSTYYKKENKRFYACLNQVEIENKGNYNIISFTPSKGFSAYLHNEPKRKTAKNVNFYCQVSQNSFESFLNQLLNKNQK